MTLEEKVGQLVMVGFDGHSPSAQVLRLVRKHYIGGIIYFARNVRSLQQVAELSDSLQQAAQEAGTLPLWIAIDQEGGMVVRITDGVALMPGAMALAAGGASEAAYEAARISGRELRALGINLNLAPVLDVNNNPRNPVIGVRSFGESPETAAAFGAAAVRGMQDGGVAATAKHFPGHGDTEVDSHLDLPTVPHGRERMFAVELKPFIAAIEAGVDCIMSAHIYFPAFETRQLPVTLSPAVLTGLLRGELNYDGVIVTDCMEMKAIASHYGTVEAAVMAIEAGADAVLVSHTYDLQCAALEALVAAVRSGRISEERIDASVRRLLTLKTKRGLLAGGTGANAAESRGANAGMAANGVAAAPGWQAQPLAKRLASVGTAQHLTASKRFSEASVTVVKDGGLLPLAAKPTLVLGIEPAVVTIVDDALTARQTIGEALAELGFEVEELVIPLAETAACQAKALELARCYDQIVIVTYNAHFDNAQAALVHELLAAGKLPIVVATRNPYDLLAFPDVPAYVCTYESRPLALQSAARLLAGRIAAQGRLPVSIGADYPLGWGVTFGARSKAE
jgi:beta-N-acetylhexosaminidase